MVKQYKIFGALALAGLFSSANAATTNVFGDVGALGNFGFGNANKTTLNNGSDSQNASVLGVKAHLGVDFQFNNSRIGVGAMAGFAPYGTPFNSVTNNYGSNLYKSPYIDVSDLYYQYGDSYKGIAVGRYNSSILLKTADWFGGYAQGITGVYRGSSAGFWATWINDWLNTGYNSSYDYNNTQGRYGLDLSSFSPYQSSWTNWNVGKRDVLAAGLDFNFGDTITINPHAAYWANVLNATGDNGATLNGHALVQAGVRMAVKLGNASSFQSTTTFRALWQNSIGADNDYGVMLWADEEFIIKDMFKIGGGYYRVGAKSIVSFTDRTRFYGQFLSPNVLNNQSLSRSYFNANTSVYYGFVGLKFNDVLNLDVLYAGGGYSELSAILNWNVLRSGNKIWSIGGGLVSNGIGGGKYNGLIFTKFAF